MNGWDYSLGKMEDRYRWQEECLDSWEANDNRGIVQAVTGAGKTIFALKAVQRLREKCGESLWTAIVVPTRALMIQWNRILRSCLLEEEALEGLQYQVYVINSARYRLARQILGRLRDGVTVLLIADECHHYTSAENRKIFEFTPYVKETPGRYCSLGLSATVMEKGSAELQLLEETLGRIFFRYSYERALREGVISEFRLIQVALHFCEDEYEEYQDLSERMKTIRRQLYLHCPLLKKEGISFFSVLQSLAREDNTEIGNFAKSFLYLSYQRKKLVCMAENRIFCVHELLREIDIRRKVLVFSESIEQADMLRELLKCEYGSKVGKYHSKAGKQANENALERFKSGEILILITCKALDEGVDVPDAGVGIILSGTGMERQRMQRLGRILRREEKKEMACLYYLFIEESMEEKSYFPLRGEYFQVEDWEYNASGD